MRNPEYLLFDFHKAQRTKKTPRNRHCRRGRTLPAGRSICLNWRLTSSGFRALVQMRCHESHHANTNASTQGRKSPSPAIELKWIFRPLFPQASSGCHMAKYGHNNPGFCSVREQNTILQHSNGTSVFQRHAGTKCFRKAASASSSRREEFPFPRSSQSATTGLGEALHPLLCSSQYFPHNLDSVSGCHLSPGDLLPDIFPAWLSAAPITSLASPGCILWPGTHPALARQHQDGN